MNLNELKSRIKQIALDSGAKLVGIGNEERLKDAPPSGDMSYCLKGAKSCIIWAIPTRYEVLEKYFSKKDRFGFAEEMYHAYSTSWKIALKIRDFIEKNSDYKAFAVIPNGKYRSDYNPYKRKTLLRLGLVFLKLGVARNMISERIADTFVLERFYPEFSLRYGAVAAGLGHLGWSGCLVTKDYGASLFLGGVLTTAPLEPDPMLTENPCNKCKICVRSCTTGLFSMDETEEPIIIGNSKEIIAKRYTYARCTIGCGGWTGLSEDGQWSTWTPGHICLKKVPEDDLKNKEYMKKFVKDLFFSSETPAVHKKFNREILRSFMKVGISENAGLRSLKDTNPRCGNCAAICVADPKKRKELYNLLITSGKMYLNEKGEEYIQK